MFDRAKKVTLVGTVKEFSWTNPHASIQVDVVNAKGAAETWGVEMNSPNNLVKQGWKSNIVKFGDKVSVVVNPLRAGEHGGIVRVDQAAGRPRPRRQVDRGYRIKGSGREVTPAGINNVLEGDQIECSAGQIQSAERDQIECSVAIAHMVQHPAPIATQSTLCDHFKHSI